MKIEVQFYHMNTALEEIIQLLLNSTQFFKTNFCHASFLEYANITLSLKPQGLQLLTGRLYLVAA